MSPCWEPPRDLCEGCYKLGLKSVRFGTLCRAPKGLEKEYCQQGRPALIDLRPEDLEQIRERLRKMSDLELRKFGRAAKDMADPRKNFESPNPAFQVQLDEARAEWRRWHPKQ